MSVINKSAYYVPLLYLNDTFSSSYVLIAQKIVYEMLHTKDAGDGLVKRLKDENMSDELITRIVADFVIAAGDTVC